MVTNLQRKYNQHCSQSHQIGKVVYESSFLPYLGTQSFFHQSVKVLQCPIPACLSIGGMLGQNRPWHSTLYISHVSLALSHETVTN